MINGKSYAWEDVSVVMPYGLALDIDSIDYDDKKSVKRVYGKGGVARRYGSGNYEASCKVSVLREDFERMVLLAKAALVGIYDLPPFPIVVAYANEDEPMVTDRLPLVKLTAVKSGSKQGEESVKVELEFEVLAPIQWNGVPATIGR
jgi:hypothetical protein